MSLKIVRNDITKINTEAIVNTANKRAVVGAGCDTAIYMAAGKEELLQYRIDHIGDVNEGDVFITPGFNLAAKYIIHAVSPLFKGGDEAEEEVLRGCYRKSLQLAAEKGIRSIAFPLISTGSFGYPKEDGLRIAVDEINGFLLKNEMTVYLVVFDDKATALGKRIYPELESYIDANYVDEQLDSMSVRMAAAKPVFMAEPMPAPMAAEPMPAPMAAKPLPECPEPKERKRTSIFSTLLNKEKGGARVYSEPPIEDEGTPIREETPKQEVTFGCARPPMREESFKQEVFVCDTGAGYEDDSDYEEPFDYELHESKLQERMKHLTDTYSQYLMYLIQSKGMENSDVWHRGIVDKKVFSKIKNNIDYHPQKLTALCLCIGAKLNLDESKDLLARAGYALSPCDKTDVIFSYFIENEIYDILELDIILEEYGLPTIIS